MLGDKVCLCSVTWPLDTATHDVSVVFLPSFPGVKFVDGKSPASVCEYLIEQIDSTGMDEVVTTPEIFWLIENTGTIPSSLPREYNIGNINFVGCLDDVLGSQRANQNYRKLLKLCGMVSNIAARPTVGTMEPRNAWYSI